MVVQAFASVWGRCLLAALERCLFRSGVCLVARAVTFEWSGFKAAALDSCEFAAKEQDGGARGQHRENNCCVGRWLCLVSEMVWA